MGFNTTVLILNDAFDQIRKHPEEFVAGLDSKMQDGGSFGVGCYANPVEVMPTQHADVFRLYCTHGNMIMELSQYSERTMELATSEHQFQRDIVLGSIQDAERMLKNLRKAIRERNTDDDR